MCVLQHVYRSSDILLNVFLVPFNWYNISFNINGNGYIIKIITYISGILLPLIYNRGSNIHRYIYTI